MRPNKKYCTLYPGLIFHVYNRTNNKEKMFLQEHDYLRFLSKLNQYITPFVSILSFNLLPNHFHLLIRVKSKSAFLMEFPKEYVSSLSPGCQILINSKEHNMHRILENRFAAMFSGYTTYYNLKYKRKGNLLNRPFNRKLVTSINYLQHVIYYINTNSVKHGLHKNFLDHQWTSFHHVMSNDGSIIDLDAVFDCFKDEIDFYQHHLRSHDLKIVKEFVLEEE